MAGQRAGVPSRAFGVKKINLLYFFVSPPVYPADQPGRTSLYRFMRSGSFRGTVGSATRRDGDGDPSRLGDLFKVVRLFEIVAMPLGCS